MTGPLISVVITNYNYAEFVGGAIESVLQQVSANLECIVVDDGSTDASLQIITRYDKVRLVRKENGGQISALQAAYPYLQGRIIIILDADDFLYKDACRRIAIEWESGLTLLQFRLDKINRRGKNIGQFPNEDFLKDHHLHYCLKHGYIPSSPMSGNAFSREYVATMLSFAIPDKRMAVDGYLIFNAPLYGKVKSISESLGAYRIHGKNMSPVGRKSYELLRGQLQNNIWFKEAFVLRAKHLGLRPKTWFEYLGPYDLKAALLISKSYPALSPIAAISSTRIAMKAVQQFLLHPNINVFARLKNVILITLIVCMPGAFARRLYPLNL